MLRGDFATYFSFNAFYPPMYDLVTMMFFGAAGISVFTGRIVSVAFSLFSIYAVFEFAYRMYGAKTALLASALMAVMPGYLWLSRMAMIETMLVFFFTVSTLFFFIWLREHQNKFLILSGVALGLGIITKYQAIIVGAIMLTSLLILGRGYLKQKFRRFPLLVLTVVAVVVPWIVVSYQLYASGMLNQWLYALSTGNPEKSLYSTGINRFPAWYNGLPSWIQTPIFYLLEMTVPYYNPAQPAGDVHPISLILFPLSIAGLLLLAWRRKPEDKYLLIWFLVVYIFFTAVPNRQWRYVLPLFPVLALSGASLVISALEKAQKTWRILQLPTSKKHVTQAGAIALMALVAVGFYFSMADAHSWVSKDQIHVPLDEATTYIADRLKPGENVMMLCAFNLMSQDMVRFYLYRHPGINTWIYQYPLLPVDTYAPDFNMSELIKQCTTYNVKYLLVDEYGQNATVPENSYHYFNSSWTFYTFNQTLMSTKRFSYEPVHFWEEGARIFILTFI